MRCNNCGWSNPDGLDKCQKCNQPLQTSSIVKQEDRRGLGSLIKEGGVAGCPYCGYPIADNCETCPNCGKHLKSVTSDNESSVQKKSSKNGSFSKSLKPDNNSRRGKMTVADISEIVDLDSIDKKTILKFDSKEEEKENFESDESGEEIFVFECMDNPEHPSVRLLSGISLDIKKGDIILIGGLRFIKV